MDDGPRFDDPDDTPHDRIILTTGAWGITPAWPEQLKPGGRLLLPLSIRRGRQGIVAFDNRGARRSPAAVGRGVQRIVVPFLCG